MIKNLSKVQKEIEVLAKRVPTLTPTQMQRAITKFPYFVKVYGDKQIVRCPDCGTAIDLTAVKQTRGSKWEKTDTTAQCPHCHSLMQIRRYYDSYGRNKPLNHQEDFFQVLNVVGDWQVTRLFYMDRYCYTRKPNTDWKFYEVAQAWNNPKYKQTYFRTLPKKFMCSYAFNPYSLYEPIPQKDEQGRYKIENGYYVMDYVPRHLEPRRAGGDYYFSTNEIVHAKIHPHYSRCGISTRSFSQLGYNAMSLFQAFADTRSAMLETLLKAGAIAVFKRIAKEDSDERCKQIFSAWKIGQRNRYDCNQKEWLDYVDMLIAQGYDYRNAHYVCPADLHTEHNKLLAEQRRLDAIRRERERVEWQIREDERRRIESERKLKDAIKEEDAFIKRREPYFGITIPSNKGFNIVVLQSIKEFKHEGDVLHHCVFHCAYYRKQDSLILSARDADNNPIETIEVNLDKFTISQCYGDHDTHTKWHEDIMDCMMNNMWRVKDVATKRAKSA